MSLAAHHVDGADVRWVGRPDLAAAFAPSPDLNRGWIFASSHPGDTQFRFDEGFEPGRHGRVFVVIVVCACTCGRGAVDQALQQPQV